MDGISAVSAVTSLVLLGGKVTVQAHGFLSKVKDCPHRVKNIEADLKSTTSILTQLEDLLEESKNSGITNPLDHSADFRDAIEGLRELFAELTVLIKKYDGTGLWKRTRWASVGQDEAMQLARLLATQKSNLQFMLVLAQSGTLSTIHHGINGNSDDLRIMMSQIHMMRANGIGFADPGRVETWFESVAEYAGTASVVGTVPESCLDDTSPSNSRRNSTAVERNGSSVSTRPRNRQFDGANMQAPKRELSAALRRELSVMATVPEGSVDNLSINHSRSSSDQALIGPNKAGVIQNSTIKLKHSWSWDRPDVYTSDGLAADHEDTASVDETVKEVHSDDPSAPGSIRNSGEFTVVVGPREVVPEIERVQMHHNIGDFVSGGWRKQQTWFESVTEYRGTSSVVETEPKRAVQLSNSMSLTEFEIRHNIWNGSEGESMLVNYDRTKGLDGRDSLLHLPPIIYRCIQYLKYALHRPWHNISFWPYEIQAYYDEDGLSILPPNFEAVPGDRRTRAGDLSSDVGGYLWRKFASGHDFNLLNIDWSLWSAPEDTVNCVGDLFMQYLHKIHAPIIPPNIGKYYDDPYYFGSFTEFENALRVPELTDDKYLLLCHILSFLHDVSLAAHRVEDAQRLFAKAFRGLFGVGEEFALHLIVEHREFLTMPEQDGDKNTFSFETTFSSKLPLPQPPVVAQPEDEVSAPLVELSSGEMYGPSFEPYRAPLDAPPDASTSPYSFFPLPPDYLNLIHEERAMAIELPTKPRPKNAKYKPPGVTEALYLIKRRHDLYFTQWVPSERAPEAESEPTSSISPPVTHLLATYTYPLLSDEDKANAVEIGDSYRTPKPATFGFSEQHTLFLIGRRQDTSFNIPFTEWCEELAAAWEAVQEPPQSPQSTVELPSPRPMSDMSYMSYSSPATDTSYGGRLIISQVEAPMRLHGLQWPATTSLTPSQLEIPVATPPTTSRLEIPATIPITPSQLELPVTPPTTTSQVGFPIWGGAVELPTCPSEGMIYWDPSHEPWKSTAVLERRRVSTVLMHKCNFIAAFKKDHSCMAYCCWEPANDRLKYCNRTCSSCLRALEGSCCIPYYAPYYTPYTPAKPSFIEYMY